MPYPYIPGFPVPVTAMSQFHQQFLSSQGAAGVSPAGAPVSSSASPMDRLHRLAMSGPNNHPPPPPPLQDKVRLHVKWQ